MPGQLPEVSLRFRLCPVFAVAIAIVLWPFGVPFGLMGLVFAAGLLLLTTALGLPRSVDLNFGFMLGLVTFAAQFLGAAFIGIEAGAGTTPAVLTTVVIWFLQLTVFGVDIHRNARTVILQAPSAAGSKRLAETAGSNG